MFLIFFLLLTMPTSVTETGMVSLDTYFSPICQVVWSFLQTIPKKHSKDHFMIVYLNFTRLSFYGNDFLEGTSIYYNNDNAIFPNKTFYEIHNSVNS